MKNLDRSPSSFTLRAFVLGALCSFFIGVGAPYGNMVLRGSYMALDFSTAGALFLFFLLVGVVNIILRAVGRGLTRAELITVYIMMIVASAIPTMGLVEYWLPILTSGFYYATPENNWASLLHPHIPHWIVPQGVEATKYFYEGAPRGVGVPWGVWIGPLLIWCTLLIPVYLVMICIMIILRKQWMEKERLIYPLVQVPLEMVRDGEQSSLFNPFFKNPVMWIGFSIPLIVGSVNALHNYLYFIPAINLSTSIPIFRRTTSLRIALSFPMVGFSYFINLDIAFGLWFFNLLANVQEGIFNITGIHSTEKLDFAAPEPILAHAGIGAMIVLVLFGLWVAREHLKDVLKKVFKKDPGIDDSGEILPYRAAFFGLIGGLLVIYLWLWVSGMPLWAISMFLFGAFVLFLGVTRIVVEGGVAAARAPIISSDFVVSGVGSSALGPAGLTALGFTYIWAADIRTFVMASCANGLKLGGEIGGRRRPLFWAMIIAILTSMGGAVWIILRSSYTYGGINLSRPFFIGANLYWFNSMASRITTPTPVNWGGWLSTGIGAAVMALLMLARQRLLWWPLHPLGFPISAIWMTDYISFSIFLAWLSKIIILKYGGPRLYRSTRPFFLGLILGQFTCSGVWLIIDFFTGMTDNMIYWV